MGLGKNKIPTLEHCTPIPLCVNCSPSCMGHRIRGIRSGSCNDVDSNTNIGGIMACIAALGEEIGWSGFLVPELAKITSFTKTALFRGIFWSIWHYPIIISGLYAPDVAKEVPLWYQLIFFTIILTSISFAYTWFRLKSGSLWTGMFLHASHNKFIQGVFSKLTTDKGATLYFIDEFGAATAVVALLVAYIFWKKRHQLEPYNRS